MESKYLVANRAVKKTLETPQFMYARIALAIFNKDPNRMTHIKRMLHLLQTCVLSLPSPNWSFIGTVRRTGASCCLFTAEDTVQSIAANNHIVELMTVAGAGLGNNYQIRSIKDPVKGGTIEHMGKQPYHKAAQGITKSNKQGTRGGALTTYISVLDPEFPIIVKARNPATVAENKVDEIDYSFLFNSLFIEKIKKAEQWMTISIYHAPDLYKAFYSEDIELFTELYEKYLNDPTVPKKLHKARDLALIALPEQYETGRLYHGDILAINTHTAFDSNIDPIHSSNLCAEITLPTKPFHDTLALYEKYSAEYAYIKLKGVKNEVVIKDVAQAQILRKALKAGSEYEGHIVESVKQKNEIALCNIAAINLNKDFTDEEYEEACYYALRTVDYVIYNSEYPFPNVEYTSQQRMSAGIGIMNYAYELARKGLFYSSEAAKQHSHFIAERHFYSLVKASLAISKERGNAPWMDRTKWPKGWMPIDTYNKNVDGISKFTYRYDWEALRALVIANKGIAHSALAAFMPGESSSQNLNATNSLYPIRDGNVLKTDGAKTNLFIAPNWTELQYNYELAWDVDVKDLVDHYAIFQKFTDQAISADYYHDFTRAGNEQLGNKKLLKDFVYKHQMGVKTQYYTNSRTNDSESNQEAGCGSGGCSL
jgi:ribonucleoside-diphosphate reductase alpha chain